MLFILEIYNLMHLFSFLMKLKQSFGRVNLRTHIFIYVF